MSSGLHDFIVAHRDEIIERARRRVSARTEERASDTKLEHGIPTFLTQLVTALEQFESPDAVRPIDALNSVRSITESARLHGRDLLTNGLPVGQVVNGYGDVCQVVTTLAAELKAEISVQEFQLFNSCLDDAIAGAVSAYGSQREDDLAYEGTERLGVMAHELRNLLHTTTLAFALIKEGRVGVNGSTGALVTRTLSGLSGLVDRALAEVRLEGSVPKLERVCLASLITEIEVSAALEAAGHGVQLAVEPGDADVVIHADSPLLTSAVTNLLQNAFKFTHAGGHVVLRTRSTLDRVSIDVGDECGGLPPGKAEELFQPFTRRGSDSTGLGLGLSIALKAVHANNGTLQVHDVPGSGCIFTIDLPRQPAIAPLVAP